MPGTNKRRGDPGGGFQKGRGGVGRRWHERLRHWSPEGMGQAGERKGGTGRRGRQTSPAQALPRKAEDGPTSQLHGETGPAHRQPPVRPRQHREHGGTLDKVRCGLRPDHPQPSILPVSPAQAECRCRNRLRVTGQAGLPPAAPAGICLVTCPALAPLQGRTESETDLKANT